MKYKTLFYVRFLASLAAASLGLGVTVFVDPPSAVACTASENCKTFCKSFIGLSDDKTNHEGDRKIIQACKITAHKRTVPYQLLTFLEMDNENHEPFRAETNRPTST